MKSRIFKLVVLMCSLAFLPEAKGAISAKPLWENKLVRGSSLTDFVMSKMDTLGVNLLDARPSDSKTFCPNYFNL